LNLSNNNRNFFIGEKENTFMPLNED